MQSWRRLTIALAGLAWAHSAWADARPGLQAFAAGEFSEALLFWREAADSGDPTAALYLGVLYDTGNGVPQDYGKALAWYERAGSAGNVTAMFNAAVMHDAGRGAPADPDAAIQWYKRAAAHGSARADYDLGLIYRERGQRRDAVAFFRKAAALGIPAATTKLVALGIRAAPGARTPDEDPAMVAFGRAQDLLLARGAGQAAAAVALFRQAAEAGNALAAYNLAYCYEHGIGLPADQAAALAWYRRSAARAHEPELRAVAEAGARGLGGR